MEKDTVITVENVSKKYCKSLKRSMLYGAMDIGRNILGLSSNSDRLRKDEFWALKDISFEVKRGETLGIIGPNGSGKTTLLKLLNGILLPDKGKITIKGRVGALIDVGAGFHPMLTGRENTYINAAILGMTKREVDKKFDEIVEFADIGDFIDTPVKYYSSGMFVRLGFAVAVHCEPDILLVDEVLAVGDIAFQTKCYGKIRALKEKGRTIVIVSHDMNLIQRQTERVCIFYKGMLYATEPTYKGSNRYLAMVSMVDEKNGNRGFLKLEDRKKEESCYEVLNSSSQPFVLDDKCPYWATYNRNEFRYGNGVASIVDFRVLNAAGEEIVGVTNGEEFLIRFKVVFVADVKNPIYGFTLKTKEGIELYRTNTLLKKIEVEKRKMGDEIWVEYRLRNNLQQGDYLISVGVSSFENGKVVPLDRRYDLAFISVFNREASLGLVNMEGEIRIFGP